ncbi:MAG TPA: hypothetical protein DCX70_06880, partial [Chitinophagaceae bacterium]|nr:hypothetical protein [Chitinophagaceae bacterium]
MDTIILWLLEISLVFLFPLLDTANGLKPAKTLSTSFLPGLFIKYADTVFKINSISSSKALGSMLMVSTGVSAVSYTHL